MEYVFYGLLAVAFIAFVVLVIRSYRKKLASGCCGASDESVKKNKLADKDKSHYPYEKTLDVDGMVCKNCSEKPYSIMRENISIEHIFSELYSVPENIRKGYHKVKVLELLLFLSGLDYKGDGANLVCESVICNDTPDDDALEACQKLGASLA